MNAKRKNSALMKSRNKTGGGPDTMEISKKSNLVLGAIVATRSVIYKTCRISTTEFHTLIEDGSVYFLRVKNIFFSRGYPLK